MAGRNAAAAVIRMAIRPGTAAAAEGGFTSALALARRRYLHGGRALNSSLEWTNAEKVDTLSQITDKMMLDMMRWSLLGASIQEFISDHRKMASPCLGIPLLVGGLFVSGFTIGYNMKTSFNAAKRQ